MALRMPQPWKHPKTGIYHFRRAVPKDLWTVIGKREEKETLGTKDPQIAKRRFAEELAKCEARWAALRAGARRLTEREAHELAAGIHDRWLIIYGDHPTSQLTWHSEWYDRLWSEPDLENSEDGMPDNVSIDQLAIPAMRKYCLAQTRFLIEDRGLVLDDWSHLLLQRAVAAALQRASLKLRAVQEGTIDPQIFARAISTLREKDSEAVPPPPLPKKAPSSETTLTSLFDRWWDEAKAAGRSDSTYQSYRATFRSFISFIGHEEPDRISPEDVVAFKDYRLNTISEKTSRKPSAKTVKDSDLVALKAVFGWAASNRRMAHNPAAGITIKLGKRPKPRSLGFTDAEARSILRATLTLMPGAEQPTTAAAKRWVPWLCAFTGARVGEMVQLRKKDLRFENGLWIIHITPEAGRVKTKEAREVVLHRQIIAQGFIDFVSSSNEDYLFVRAKENGEIKGSQKGMVNRLGEFVRTIVTDRNIRPNHAWRHRFKTIGREVGIDGYVLHAIEGHEPRFPGEDYGDVSLKTIANAIAVFPDINLEIEEALDGAPSILDVDKSQASHA